MISSFCPSVRVSTSNVANASADVATGGIVDGIIDPQKFTLPIEIKNHQRGGCSMNSRNFFWIHAAWMSIVLYLAQELALLLSPTDFAFENGDQAYAGIIVIAFPYILLTVYLHSRSLLIIKRGSKFLNMLPNTFAFLFSGVFSVQLIALVVGRHEDYLESMVAILFIILGIGWSSIDYHKEYQYRWWVLVLFFSALPGSLIIFYEFLPLYGETIARYASMAVGMGIPFLTAYFDWHMRWYRREEKRRYREAAAVQKNN